MAGKHQVFSSKKATRSKATRSWRRKAKLQDKAIQDRSGKRRDRKGGQHVGPLESTAYADAGPMNPVIPNEDNDE